jgi:SAM-dependent methyltransferase
MPVPPLPIKSIEEQHLTIGGYLQQRANAGEISILEAGCGRKWNFDLRPAKYTITGVDTDTSALNYRQHSEKDLDSVILGDLREVDFPAGSYDIIYNAFVLEHIFGAEKVLLKFKKWLKPGGLLILYIPDPKSAYGFLANLTPHWFHVLFYRYILGQKNAGKPGFAPYSTVYDEVVSREGICRFAKENNLRICEEFGFYRPTGIANLLIDLVQVLSFGRLKSSHCNLVYVLEKPPAAAIST